MSGKFFLFLTQSNFSLGDKRIEGLTKIIKENRKIKEFNFRNNCLSPKTGESLKFLLNNTIENINLSRNKLGTNGAINLSNHLSQPNCNLRILNLESNKLGTDNITVLT